jgi:hypothetical protein
VWQHDARGNREHDDDDEEDFHMSNAQGIQVPTQQAPQNQQTVAESGNGFITGADQRQPQMTAAEWQAANGANGQGYVQQQPGQNYQQPAQQQQAPGQVFTAEDIARARQDEKDKLYGRIEEMGTQLQTLAQEREERAAAEQARLDEIAAQEQAARESALDTRQLLEQKDQEWNQRFATLERERDTERALREQEGRFMAVNEYRRNRIEQEAHTIMPELRDLVVGASEEEVEASIAAMQQRTEAILASVQGAVTQQRQQVRGVGITAPPVGPMEQQTTFETLTPDDIRSMDMTTYAKYRDRLLQQTRQQR